MQSLLAVGFLLGFRHAFEPDHLAAVSTLASRQGSVRCAVRLGLSWALGHGGAVAAVSAVLLAGDWRLPAAFAPAADLLVAVLLVALGALSLVGVPGGHARSDRTSFGIGVAHGLAGSGAIVLLMVATAGTRADQLGYLGAFGAGTAAGMAAVSAAIAGVTRIPRHGHWTQRLRAGSALASIAIGVALGADCVRSLAA